MDTIPSEMLTMIRRLKGISTSHVKIHSESSSTTASPGKVLRFTLPSNSLCHLGKGLRLLFNAKTTGTGRLPPVEDLIERISVYGGGILLSSNFSEYNTLRNVKKIIEGSDLHGPDILLGHREIVRDTSYVDGTTVTANEDYNAPLGDKMFCIDYFEGLLSSIQPSIVDLSVFPTIVVEFSLAPATVIPSCTDNTLANFGTVGSSSSYELSNISLECEIIGMADNTLSELQSAMMMQQQYLPFAFKNYFSFVSHHQSTTKINVNSASFDKLYLCYRDPAVVNTTSPPVSVTGYKTASDPTYNIASLGTSGERYINKQFEFKSMPEVSTVDTEFQLALNNANIPGYRMKSSEFLSLSKQACEYNEGLKNITYEQYLKHFFVQALRLSLPSSTVRNPSGLDTRGTSSNLSIQTQNLKSTGVQLVAFAECTSEIQVMPGRALSVVV